MKSNTFKNASEQTAANIKKIASVLPSFTKEYIDQLPTEAIGQAFNAGDLKDLANIDEDKVQSLGWIWQYPLGNYTNISPYMFNAFGELWLTSLILCVCHSVSPSLFLTLSPCLSLSNTRLTRCVITH